MSYFKVIFILSIISFSSFAEEQLHTIMRNVVVPSYDFKMSENTSKADANLLKLGVVQSHDECTWYDNHANEKLSSKIINGLYYLNENDLILLPANTTEVVGVDFEWISKDYNIAKASKLESLSLQPSSNLCRIDPDYKWEGGFELTENDCRMVINCEYLNLINFIDNLKISSNQRNNGHSLYVNIFSKTVVDKFLSPQKNLVCI